MRKKTNFLKMYNIVLCISEDAYDTLFAYMCSRDDDDYGLFGPLAMPSDIGRSSKDNSSVYAFRTAFVDSFDEYCDTLFRSIEKIKEKDYHFVATDRDGNVVHEIGTFRGDCLR